MNIAMATIFSKNMEVYAFKTINLVFQNLVPKAKFYMLQHRWGSNGNKWFNGTLKRKITILDLSLKNIWHKRYSELHNNASI